MISVTLTEARARLPELLTKAAEGEEVHILRHGKSVAVLIGHSRWVKTKQHDVLIQARQLRKQIEEARGTPWRGPVDTGWDVEAHLAELRADRDDDPWDHVGD